MLDFVLAIVSHTPSWVWVALGLIVWAGLAQTRTRDIAARRVILMPALLLAFSLWGAWSAFGRTGLALVLALWGIGIVLGWSSNRVLDLPRQVSANADGSFRVGGSFAPMLLMLCVFLTRYVNGVALAIKPALAANPGYVIAATLVFAVPTGLFAARSRKVWAARVATHAPVAA